MGGQDSSARSHGPQLSLEGVGVRYPVRRESAIADVSLSVAAGELVGVAGRTGAGKSTLALASAGFIPRVVRARLDGSVRIDGIATAGSTAADLAGRVGVVFSTPANQLSASKLTVREELAFGLENLAVRPEAMQERISAVLDEFGIAHLAERDPSTLSGGEQQRVAIASIVAMGTPVLILDEPTAQLDPDGTRIVARLLRTLADDGRSVVCAEHAPELLGLADRCLVLELGRQIALATPGRALGWTVLEPLGLRPPTIVGLAELAGLAPDRAFDEGAITAALESWLRAKSPRRFLGRLTTTPKGPPRDAQGQTAIWSPVFDRAPAEVAIRGLVHRYPGGIEAIRGIDLSIAPGAAVAIVGQNGSGKTTLAKHLNGLLRPDAGAVVMGGRDIAKVPVSEMARTVGFVFQDPADQLFNRSVEREVAFGPRNLGLRGAQVTALVASALALTGLEAERATNPYDLGPSLRKLVALASVLAMEPPILVLDEPTTGQDDPGVRQVGQIVDSFRRAGRTVIAITHDMEFAADHFERIVVLREGQIVVDGRPSEVFASGNDALIRSTGLVPPVSARIGARLGLGATPTYGALMAALAARA